MHIVILSLFVPPIKQISIVVLLLRRIDRLLHQWQVYLADEPEAAIILLVYLPPWKFVLHEGALHFGHCHLSLNY